MSEDTKNEDTKNEKSLDDQLLDEIFRAVAHSLAHLLSLGVPDLELASSAARIGIEKLARLGVRREMLIALVNLSYNADGTPKGGLQGAPLPTVCVACVDMGDAPAGAAYRLARPRETCCLCGGHTPAPTEAS